MAIARSKVACGASSADLIAESVNVSPHVRAILNPAAPWRFKLACWTHGARSRGNTTLMPYFHLRRNELCHTRARARAKYADKRGKRVPITARARNYLGSDNRANRVPECRQTNGRTLNSAIAMRGRSRDAQSPRSSSSNAENRETARCRWLKLSLSGAPFGGNQMDRIVPGCALRIIIFRVGHARTRTRPESSFVIFRSQSARDVA